MAVTKKQARVMARDRRVAQVSLDATLQAMNELMRVQFQNVEKNFDRMHEAMNEMKTEIKTDAGVLEKKVEKNRQVAEDRHVSIIKKVWMGAGAVAAFEALLQFSACHVLKGN